MWTAVDPVGQFWSPYAYGNNPILGIDPDGLEFDYLSMSDDEFQLHLDFLSTCDESQYTMYASLADDPDNLYTMAQVESYVIPSSMAWDLAGKRFVYKENTLSNTHTFVQEITHAYDDMYGGTPDYLQSLEGRYSPAIVKEVHGWDEQVKYMNIHNIPMSKAKQYYWYKYKNNTLENRADYLKNKVGYGRYYGE